jgi:HEPN domain-containing protein
MLPTMTNDEKYNYWLTYAQYDLDTAEAMFSIGNRYPDFMNDLTTTVNKNDAGYILQKTKEVFQWLQTLKQ